MTRPVAFIGPSGAGKTTLLVELIRYYRTRGVSTGVIKHGHHQPNPHSGDTQLCLRAGAVHAIYATEDRFWRFDRNGLIGEGRFESPDELTALLTDRVLIEGFKHQGSWPRILVVRAGLAAEEISSSRLAAIVTDEPVTSRLPSFLHNAVGSIAEFVDRISIE